MPGRPRPTRPTLDEVRGWPATVSVAEAALALGISRAYAYRCIQGSQFPVRTLLVGSRLLVSTPALIAFLSGAPTPGRVPYSGIVARPGSGGPRSPR